MSYLVAYDICCPDRLRQVHRIVRSHGQRLQLSVYRCALTERERVLLSARLLETIDIGVDRVLFIRLGPADAPTVEITTLGAGIAPDRHGPIIV